MARRTFGEFDGIEVLRSQLEVFSSERVKVGIGDDAAVLRRPDGELVVSVDASREGVHFELAWMSLEQAAERSFHAAVSDLAAMAAVPLAAVCALELPRGAGRRVFAAIGKGQTRAARELGCPLVGGNVTTGSCFGFTTTVFGTPFSKPRLRSGAKHGDRVWLSHETGWAALGLHLFQHGLATRTERGVKTTTGLGKWTRRALHAFTNPRAKLLESREWCKRVNSLIDTSDSVASEVRHLARASNVRVVLDEERVLAAHGELRTAARQLGLDPLQLILFGGEDYALLGTGPANKRPEGAIEIGFVEAGRGALVNRHGQRIPLGAGGFDHLTARA